MVEPGTTESIDIDVGQVVERAVQGELNPCGATNGNDGLGTERHNQSLPREPGVGSGDVVGAPSIPPSRATLNFRDASVARDLSEGSKANGFTRRYYNFDALSCAYSNNILTKDTNFGTGDDLPSAADADKYDVFDVGQYPGLPCHVAPTSRGADASGEQSGPGAGAGQSPQPLTIRCDECSGRGRYTIGRPNDPSAELFVCEVCDGSGEAICCECREPATVLHHVNCRPALAMPLCAKHHAEYLEDAA